MPILPSRPLRRLLVLSLSALLLGATNAAAAAPIDLGPAKDGPRLVTDGSGVGHLTWARQSTEQLEYCRAEAGLSQCAGRKTFPTLGGYEPQDRGNAPLLNGGTTLVLTTRQTGGEDRKLLYSSADGFNVPQTVATASIAQINDFTDAVLAPVGTVNAAARILTVNSGPVSPNGGKFQALGTTTGEMTGASAAISNGDETCAESVAHVGPLVYVGFIDCDVIHPQTTYLRRYQGDGALANLNDEKKWAAPILVGPGYSNVVLAAGPSGLYIANDLPGGDGAVVLRKFTTPTFSDPVVLGTPDSNSGWFALFQDASGVLHFSWQQGGNLLYRYGRDASNSSFTNPQTLATGGNFHEQRIGVNAAGHGWISWLDFGNSHAMVMPLAPGEPSTAADAPAPTGGQQPPLYKGPTKDLEKPLGRGLKATLTTPKGCVPGGFRFQARLRVKSKGTRAHKVNYTVKKVKFLLGGKLISTDRKKPFEVTFGTAGQSAGKTLAVTAKVSVRLRKGKRHSTVGKTLKATVKICGG